MGVVITGRVEQGNRIGRKLGFPTANISISNKPDVRDGVYAVKVRTPDGEFFQGMANIGTRPTVTESKKRFLEVNIFGFGDDLYGKTIDVELLAYIREERTFASVEELKEQIEKDKQCVLAALD